MPILGQASEGRGIAAFTRNFRTNTGSAGYSVEDAARVSDAPLSVPRIVHEKARMLQSVPQKVRAHICVTAAACRVQKRTSRPRRCGWPVRGDRRWSSDWHRGLVRRPSLSHANRGCLPSPVSASLETSRRSFVASRGSGVWSVPPSSTASS